MAKRSIEVFTAGCPVCEPGVALVREAAGGHEVTVRDLHRDPDAAEQARRYGIKTVPAVVVDGALLGCCRTTGPTREELTAALGAEGGPGPQTLA
jgi:glutaredoxin